MKRSTGIALAVVLAIGGAIVAYRIYLASLSEEVRIRNMLSGIAGAFNDASASRITDRLDVRFSEEKSGLDRREVQVLLVHFFLRERDRKSRKPLWKVEVRPEDIALSLEDEQQGGSPANASVEVTARFSKQAAGEAEASPAVMLFKGKLVKTDGRWVIARAGYRILEGRWPF